MMQIRRAKLAVDALHGKGAKRNHAAHSLQLLRNKMVLFVSNLQNYIVTKVRRYKLRMMTS